MNYRVIPYVYYTLSADAFLNKPSAHLPPEDLQINILVSKRSQLCLELYRGISLLDNDCMISFTTSFLAETINEKNLLSEIFCLTSLGNIASNKMLPIFVNSEKDLSVEVVESVVKYFNLQGISLVEMPFFLIKKNAGWQKSESCLLLTVKDDANHPIIEDYSFYKKTTTVIILLRKMSSSETNLNELNMALPDYETSATINPDLNTYLTGQIFNLEIALWKGRTLLYQDFLSISKAIQEKEYYEILDWYKSEYEILPLWYKRFGHIIKVIMGKRSFRSLFSDKVKKYNN